MKEARFSTGRLSSSGEIKVQESDATVILSVQKPFDTNGKSFQELLDFALRVQSAGTNAAFVDSTTVVGAA